MILSKHAADAVVKLRATKELLPELDQLRIVQDAIDAAIAPHTQDVEAHRNLANNTSDKFIAAEGAYKKTLSDKENELIGARARITELEADNASLQKQLSGFKSQPQPDAA